MKTEPVELAKVPFYDDVIEAAKDPDGKVMVSVRRVCESLGIDLKTLWRKLRGCRWATVDNFDDHAEGNGTRFDLADPPTDALASWRGELDRFEVLRLIGPYAGISSVTLNFFDPGATSSSVTGPSDRRTQGRR